VRVGAARALGEVGPAAKEAVPALIAALKGMDDGVRESAASALGRIGPAAREAIPALEAAARDGVWGAESALKKIRGEE
jgi:HEAT repeat protein